MQKGIKPFHVVTNDIDPKTKREIVTREFNRLRDAVKCCNDLNKEKPTDTRFILLLEWKNYDNKILLSIKQIGTTNN